MSKKKIYTALCAAVMITSFLACEKDLPLYDDSQARLDFYYATSGDSVLNYSFNYHHGVERDTIWLEVRTVGFVSQQDRYYEVQQIPVDSNNAVPDRHYVSFDNASYQQMLCIPAGAVRAQLPIIVLKDASLDEQDVTLKLAIKDNGIFQPGNIETLTKTINLSNRLVQPTLWSTLMLWYFGHWGPVKHQFMIDHSTAKWDDEYLHEIGVDDIAGCDQTYVQFLQGRLINALTEENERRTQNGLPWLTEVDGTIIRFANELYGY